MAASSISGAGAGRPSGPRTLWVRGALLGGVVLAIIQAGPTIVDLRLGPLMVVVAGAAALTLALQGLTSFLGDYASRDRRAAELDEALALWPPLGVGQASAFDLGVRPEAWMGAGSMRPYRGRPEDREIDDALENADVVLLIGPAGSGKSRAAVEALGRVREDAQLIVPEDAVGLTRVLQGVSDLLGASNGDNEHDARYVLWLDDLERFVDALHLDALDDFQRSSSDPPRGTRARVADFVSGSRSRCEVQIVATIREDRLRRLLTDGGETANVARRFVARARRVHVPRRRPRFADMSCRPSDPLFHPERLGVLPAALRERPPVPRALNFGGVLAVLFAAVFVAWVALGDPVRPGAAPPLAEQLADIRNTDDQCGLVATSPRRADAVDTSVVAVLGQDGCTESDRLNVYAYHKGRLNRLHGTIALGQADPPQRITCLGSEKPDPCHAEIAGGNEMVVIGFRSTATNHLLPAVVWSHDDRLQVASLGLPPPADLRAGARDGEVRRAQAVDLTPVALPLSGRVVLGCGPPQCLRGYTAAALAILAPAGDSPTATLLAGYVRRGSLEAPERLEVRGFRFIFVGPRPQVGPPCRIERRGKALPVSATVRPGQSMSAAMRRAWVRVRATATAATCPFDAALSDGLRARSTGG